METKTTPQRQGITASLLLGGSLLDCFIAAGVLDRRAGQTFTEEHYHASYELLLCQGGAGFQFANGTAYDYREDTVFLFPPHQHPGQRDRRAAGIRPLSVQPVGPEQRPGTGGAHPLRSGRGGVRPPAHGRGHGGPAV